MKKTAFAFLLMMIMATAGFAQVVFKFSDGISDSPLKDNVERNVSRLLTEINRAQQGGEALNLSNIRIADFARSGLTNLWRNLPFRCEFRTNVQSCLRDATEYEIRQIPVEVMPKSNTYRGERHKELTISFDKSGLITGVRMALDNNTYESMVRGNAQAVEDIEERRTIAKFVEDFRSFYVEKNATAIYNIFAEDALIITGRVLTPVRNKTSEVVDPRKKTIYTKQNREQYVNKLRAIFGANKEIHVDFSDIEIIRHGSRKGFYGVRLRQKWENVGYSGKGYSDEGALFLLWDFRDKEKPLIHVRAWTPWENVMGQDDLLMPEDFKVHQ